MEGWKICIKFTKPPWYCCKDQEYLSFYNLPRLSFFKEISHGEWCKYHFQASRFQDFHPPPRPPIWKYASSSLKFESFLHSFVIFWCKKNGIFTLKNEILKQADFASEWRKSRFRGLEILKLSGGGCPRTPFQEDRLRQPPFIEPPLLKKKPGSAPAGHFHSSRLFWLEEGIWHFKEQDPSITCSPAVHFRTLDVTVKQSSIVSPIDSCSVVLPSFAWFRPISRLYGAGNCWLWFSGVCSKFILS